MIKLRKNTPLNLTNYQSAIEKSLPVLELLKNVPSKYTQKRAHQYIQRGKELLPSHLASTRAHPQLFIITRHSVRLCTSQLVLLWQQ